MKPLQDDINLNLSYGGNDLPENITQQLIDYAENELNVPPSYLITKLNYEGLWGGSNTAQLNNNWGGMTWVENWSDPYKRASGVMVTRGSSRPPNEGGYYIKYESVQDFIVDWSYLIRKGGIYNVANSDTFDESVKGMFKYGGAQYDYATMNVEGSKRRYELYLQGMKNRRNAINNANDNVLDKLDENNYSTNPNPDIGNEDYDSILDKVDNVYNDLKGILSNFENNVIDILYNLFKPYLYDYGRSEISGNHLIKVTKITENMNKLDITINVKDMFSDVLDNINDTVNSGDKEKDNIEKKDDEANPNPDKNNTPFFPTKVGLRMSSPYGWRVHPITGKRTFHAGTDWGGGGSTHPIYATQDAKVTVSSFSDTGGWMVYLKHTGDKYHSRYLHLHEQPIVNVGSSVKKGQRIGTMGTTGSSTGIHLHFEVATSQDGFGTENGTIDPEKYLKMRF